MKQTECPRYQKCSAAICPLWRPVLEQTMLKGERVCGILLEYSKADSQAILTTLYGADLMQVIAEANNDIKSHGGYLLRSALQRAANTNSRLRVTHALSAETV